MPVSVRVRAGAGGLLRQEGQASALPLLRPRLPDQHPSTADEEGRQLCVPEVRVRTVLEVQPSRTEPLFQLRKDNLQPFEGQKAAQIMHRRKLSQIIYTAMGFYSLRPTGSYPRQDYMTRNKVLPISTLLASV